MSLRRAHDDAVLTSEEIAMIRYALSASSNLLTWAAQHGSWRRSRPGGLSR